MKKDLLIKPRATDYILGVNSPIKFKAIGSGDWSGHIWQDELQRNPNFDSDGCVCFSFQESFDAQMDAILPTLAQNIQGQIASMGFMDTGLDGKLHFHSSARFVEIMTGNGTNGNSMPDACDAARKYGMLPWTDLPFTPTMTQEEYFTPVSSALMAKAQQFLALIGGESSVQYHWVAKNAPKNTSLMQSAILQAPLLIGIAVAQNWNQPIPSPDPSSADSPEHCVMVYKMDSPATDIFDHYLPFMKVLDGGYPINYVLQMVLQVNPPQPPQPVPVQPAPALQQPAINSNISLWLTLLSQWLQTLLKGRNLSSNQMSGPYTISVAEAEQWGNNLLTFLIPVGVIYLTSVVAVINSHGLSLSAFSPDSLTMGAMTLYVLNGALDFLRKFVPNTQS